LPVEASLKLTGEFFYDCDEGPVEVGVVVIGPRSENFEALLE
jgi:hypothetical protein